MSNNIEGKVVIITGASSGLGEATARLLSALKLYPGRSEQQKTQLGEQMV
jgi:NADP-dependent 3-hydroxy acid dehydrogenase YdfG